MLDGGAREVTLTLVVAAPAAEHPRAARRAGINGIAVADITDHACGLPHLRTRRWPAVRSRSPEQRRCGKECAGRQDHRRCGTMLAVNLTGTPLLTATPRGACRMQGARWGVSSISPALPAERLYSLGGTGVASMA